jgi:prepilin-type N-terminal cleavage/methylation domain-containing protein
MRMPGTPKRSGWLTAPSQGGARLASRTASRGFTLIEIVVTVALLAIVLGLLVRYPLMSTFQYFRSATARADAQSAARTALDTMAREITEAMYVQLDMYDNSMVALVPPLRVDRDDPNSEVVSPPRPDWDREIRFWRALYDPTRDYNPVGQYGAENTFYLARTEIPDPGEEGDPWNRWNANWALQQSNNAAEGVRNWSPISRVVHTDVDWRYSSGQVGMRNETLQPGFPYLWIQYQLAEGLLEGGQAARAYRDYAVALTPSTVDFDVTRLEFRPTVVAGEWLQLIGGASGEDKSVYQSQYPLWRLGAPYTGWAALSGEAYLGPAMEQWYWARDPFLLIYRYRPDDPANQSGSWGYGLFAVGAFDPRTRTLKVMNPEGLEEVYDSGLYPYRPAAAWSAFGVDWVKGTLRSDFPSPGDEQSMWGERPIILPNAGLGLSFTRTVAESSQDVVDVPLLQSWGYRSGGAALRHFVVPGSVRVRVGRGGAPERTLTEVFCTPRDYSDQFQVGSDERSLGDEDPSLSSIAPRYGWIRLPARLAGGTPADDPNVSYHVDFRWRNNGVWVNGEEHPDKISAYYRTAAVLDISIGVRKAGMRRRGGERVTQAVNMTRRVKLRNAFREVRHAEE